MKYSRSLKVFFTLNFIFFVCLYLFAQKTEINFNSYSGFSKFRGDGASSNAKIFLNNFGVVQNEKVYPNYLYGGRSGFAFSFEGQLQRISKAQFIYCIGISYEILHCKLNIDTVIFSNSGPIANISKANGQAENMNQFITLNPFVGKRYRLKKIMLDLNIGLDLGFCLKSIQSGRAITTITNFYNISYDGAFSNALSKPFVNISPRMQLKVQYKKFSFLTGYSLGLTNIQTSGNPKVYSSYFRLGLGYQVK